jgi:hypothetical protein
VDDRADGLRPGGRQAALEGRPPRASSGASSPRCRPGRRRRSWRPTPRTSRDTASASSSATTGARSW